MAKLRDIEDLYMCPYYNFLVTMTKLFDNKNCTYYDMWHMTVDSIFDGLYGKYYRGSYETQ